MKNEESENKAFQQPLKEFKEKDSLVQILYEQARYIQKLEDVLENQGRLISNYQSALMSTYREERDFRYYRGFRDFNEFQNFH